MRRALLLALCLLPGYLRAGNFQSSGRGGSSAAFLRLPAGARATALGRAYTAASGGADAFFWNPAGLSGAPRSAFFSHSVHLDDAFADFASAVFPVGKKKKARLGLGAVYVSAGRVDRLDANGNELGSYTPNDLAAGVSLARPLGRFHAGATVKLIRSTLLDSAQTAALDAGVQWLGVSDRLRLGAALSNLGGTLKYGEEAEDLPLVLRAGAAVNIGRGTTLAADASFPRDNAPSVSIGLESPVAVSDGFSLLWRAGYDGRTTADLDGFSGYSIGLGFRGAGSLGFDYAFLPMGLAGGAHTASLSRRF